MRSICELMEEDERKWAKQPYIFVKRDGEFSPRTFGEVIGDARALARGLLAEGVRGRVMLYSRNSYEWVVADLAVLGYVGVCVPIDSEWTAFDISNALSAVGTDAVLYERAKSAVIGELREKFPAVRFVCIEDSFPALLGSGRDGAPLSGRRDIEETAMILFTSGTTNRPKAIPLTQKNLLHNWDALCARTPMTAADSSYIFLPLNHVYAGVANFLYTIISGMRVYLCSDRSKITEEMLEVRPTVVCTVPLILNRIYEAADARVMEMLRNIRFLYCGGSFTDPAIKRFFIENGVNLLEAYGTTETSSVIALAKQGDDNLECCGVILEGLDVTLTDPDENGVGEITVGGGSVSAGYLSRNDNYSEFDELGRYHTGDLGYIDEKRRLFLKGRKKRMIITANGKNVYVDELERLILQNPAISAATVFEEDFRPAARLYTDLAEDEARRYIGEVNEKLPKFKRIKNLYVKRETGGGRLK